MSLCSLLHSCGFSGLKKVIVPNLSYILADKVGDELDLYYSQEKKLKKELDHLFKQEIDQVKRLRDIIEKIDLSKSKAEVVVDELISVFRKTLLAFNKVLAKYTARLTLEQQKRFFKIQERENEKIKKRLKQKDLAKIIERYEFFFGELSQTQLSIIRANTSSFMALISKRLNRRMKSQIVIRSCYGEKNIATTEKKILALYNQNLINGQKQMRKGKGLEILKQVLKSVSSEQQKHFEERKRIILEWIDEFIKVYRSKES